MTLDVAYSYSINLTEEEKFDIDKKVKKNRFELKYAISPPQPPPPLSSVFNARCSISAG
jgi:hypothetical protein